MSEPTAPRHARHLHQVTARSLSGAAPEDEALVPETSATDAPIGILAGGGGLPRILADSIIASGGQVHIVGLKGEADASIEAYSHSWCDWGAIGGMLRSFRRARCQQLIIIGAVRRPDLARIRPDLGFWRSLPTVLALLRGGDDSVLSKVVRFFEAQGFIVRGAHEVAPQLLAGAGTMGAHAATSEQARAIARGAALLRALAPFDIGQAVLACPDKIIAIEGTPGTDAMIRNAIANMKTNLDRTLGQTSNARAAHQSTVRSAAEPPQRADMVLVKLPKPGQEMRVDMPTIGPQTTELLASAGVAGIAVAQYQTLMLERDRLIAMADAAGLFVTGIERALESGTPERSLLEVAPIEALGPLKALGRLSPRPRDWQDIDMATRLLAVLQRQDAGHAAVVSRNYVLAVQSILPLARLLQDLGREQPWGSLLSKRRGVLVLRQRHQAAAGGVRASYPVVDAQVIHCANIAGLAGIAFCDGAVDLAGPQRQEEKGADGRHGAAESPVSLSHDALAEADKSRLFIVGPGAKAPGS